MKKLKFFIALQLSMILSIGLLSAADGAFENLIKASHFPHSDFRSKDKNHFSKECPKGKKGHKGPKGMTGPQAPPLAFGSFFAGTVGVSSFQAVTMGYDGPETATVLFPYTSASVGVESSESFFVVPNSGYYEINWDVTADGYSTETPIGASIYFFLDLLVNDTATHPSPQAANTTPYQPYFLGLYQTYSGISPANAPSLVTSYSSVILPLLENDVISLQLTVASDSSISAPVNGSGVRISNANISIKQISN